MRILIVPFVVWLLTEGYKFLRHSLVGRKFSLGYFLQYGGYGGMPSSHSALVTSLATAVALTEGVRTSLFAITFVFATITIYDALRLRNIVEAHSRALNKLREGLPNGNGLYPSSSEDVGHSISEVGVGIIIGVSLTVALHVLLKN